MRPAGEERDRLREHLAWRSPVGDWQVSSAGDLTIQSFCHVEECERQGRPNIARSTCRRGRTTSTHSPRRAPDESAVQAASGQQTTAECTHRSLVRRQLRDHDGIDRHDASTSAITSPLSGAALSDGSAVTITGTAADKDGRRCRWRRGLDRWLRDPASGNEDVRSGHLCDVELFVYRSRDIHDSVQPTDPWNYAGKILPGS